jgi:hypothetical protein
MLTRRSQNTSQKYDLGLPYLSWKNLLVYLNTCNTAGATCGAGTAYHFGEPEYTPRSPIVHGKNFMYILTR